MANTNRVSIIIPAYNEEQLLPTFLKELLAYCRKYLADYEIILVENGSTDQTLALAQKFAARSSQLRVSHLTTPGYGLALLKGLRLATGNYFVIFNVDFWDSRFLDLAKVDLLNYDLVIASKNLPASRDHRPFSRRFVSRSFNFLLKLVFGFQGTDTHGIKIFNAKVRALIKACRTTSGIVDTELVIRTQQAGYSILELPIEITEKRANRFGLKRIFQTPKDLLTLYRALAPGQ